jgi:hypothetical protein
MACLSVRSESSTNSLLQAGDNGGKPREGQGVARILRSYMARYHAPALLKTATQAMVLTVFVGVFLLSIGAVQHISRCAVEPEASRKLPETPGAVRLHHISETKC